MKLISMKRIYPLFGIVGPLVYILAVFIGGAIRNDYSPLYNAISELTMQNAPNQFLLDLLFGIYNVFLLIFALGAYNDPEVEGKKFNAAVLILATIGILGLLILIFTQDPRGVPATFHGTLHIVLSGISAALTIIAVVLVGLQFKGKMKYFHMYSFLTALLIFLSGGASAVSISNNSAYGGLFERITIFLFMIWVITLSYLIIKCRI